MRISKQKKEENIQSVLDAVVEMSKDTHFDSLTMKAISKKAGIGEATIYNYFPKKERILTVFLEQSFKKAIAKTQNEPLERLTFTEIFHTLIENHIEELTPAKKFFETSVQSLFLNPMSLAQTSVAQSKKMHIDFLRTEFQSAIHKEQFTPPPFNDFLINLLWDYHIGIIYYWLKNDSEESMRTTELVSLSMGVLEELLNSNILGKIYSVAHFLFKEHILNKLLNPLGKSFEKQ